MASRIKMISGSSILPETVDRVYAFAAQYAKKLVCLSNNPETAIFEILKNHPEFEINKSIDYKLLISVAQDGFLKSVK